MKKFMRLMLSLGVIVLMVSIVGCKPVAEDVATVEAPVTAQTQVDEEVVLTLSNDAESKSFTMTELHAMTITEGYAGIKTSTGRIIPPELFRGVLLTDLLQEIGGLNPSLAVEIGAKDGYTMTFSPDQIEKNDFITYDPGTGDETTKAGDLSVLIAFEKNGQPLDSEEDGDLRLVVISKDLKQVTDGHWSVKWVTSIALKPLAAEWDLAVEGALIDTIDRGSFESCSTGQCHPATWTDDKSQEWSGTPLWLIVARADDDIKHDTGAFNRALAAAGYTVDIVATDGYTVTLDSAKIAENNTIILSNKMNGNPLAEKDFPLKLVGPDLSKKEMVSGVVKIVIHFSEAPAVEQTTQPAIVMVTPTGSFQISGLIESPVEIAADLFSTQTAVQATVEHPKKGAMDVMGVPLKTILAMAIIKPEAKTLSIIASDGYSADADLAGVLACENCLVTVSEDGKYNLVMPGFESNAWVKDVVTFELKVRKY